MNLGLLGYISGPYYPNIKTEKVDESLINHFYYYSLQQNNFWYIFESSEVRKPKQLKMWPVVTGGHSSEHNLDMNIKHLQAVIQSLPEMGQLHVNIKSATEVWLIAKYLPIETQMSGRANAWLWI